MSTRPWQPSLVARAPAPDGVGPVSAGGQLLRCSVAPPDDVASFTGGCRPLAADLVRAVTS